MRSGTDLERFRGFGKSKMNLRRSAREPPHRHSGEAVLLLNDDRNAMARHEAKCDASHVPTRGHERGGPSLRRKRTNTPPGGKCAAHGFPVLPGRRTVQRMEIEKLVRELSSRENLA